MILALSYFDLIDDVVDTVRNTANPFHITAEEKLGPEGSNEVYVFAIETDPNTDMRL